MTGEYQQDAAQLASDDTLEVVRRSPVLRAVQAVPVGEVQSLLDALNAAIDQRMLDNATQHSLNVIGRIVGVYPRPLRDADALVYFSPDVDEAGPDISPVFVTGAPVAGFVPLNDVEYREAIRTKIIKNHVRYGSAPELLYYGLFAYGVPVSVRNDGLGDVVVTVPALTTPVAVVLALISEATDETADHIFHLPLPTTARIKSVFFKPSGAFAPDLDSGAPDVGLLGVSYGIYP